MSTKKIYITIYYYSIVDRIILRRIEHVDVDLYKLVPMGENCVMVVINATAKNNFHFLS